MFRFGQFPSTHQYTTQTSVASYKQMYKGAPNLYNVSSSVILLLKIALFFFLTVHNLIKYAI